MFNTSISYANCTYRMWSGCTHISPGCEHCHDERLANRFKDSWGAEWGAGKPRKLMSESYRKQPLAWNRKAEREGKRYRVLTLGGDPLDLEVPISWFTELIDLILHTPHLDWLFLTKRIDNWRHRIASMQSYGKVAGDNRMEWLGDSLCDGIKVKNLWLGLTVCNQQEADDKIPILLSIPATKRWLSIEPMLGPIETWIGKQGGWLKGECVDWVVCGGESGPGARPMHPDWARSIRDQCKAAGVPFFFKQWGEWLHWSQAKRDGKYPEIADWSFYNSPANGFNEKRTHVWPDQTHSYIVGKCSGNLLDGQKWQQIPE